MPTSTSLGHQGDARVTGALGSESKTLAPSLRTRDRAPPSPPLSPPSQSPHGPHPCPLALPPHPPPRKEPQTIRDRNLPLTWFIFAKGRMRMAEMSVALCSFSPWRIDTGGPQETPVGDTRVCRAWREVHLDGNPLSGQPGETPCSEPV